MEITIKTGTTLVPTKTQEREIMQVLLGEKEKPTPTKKKKQNIMGSRRWTASEDEIIKDHPHMTVTRGKELARLWLRTPNAIHQRHSKLVTNSHEMLTL